MPVVESTMVFSVEALQPASPPLDVPYFGDESNIAHVATQVEEVDLVKGLDRESFIRLYPELLYYELDRDTTVVDELYGETREPQFKVAIPIPIYIRIDPPANLLKRYGIEGEHFAIGLVSNGWLEKNAPTLGIATGDRLGYYDQPFTGTFDRPGGLPPGQVTHESTPATPNFHLEVLTSKACDYFGNTQVPIHRVLTLKNLRNP
jgi:hypothetical protein